MPLEGEWSFIGADLTAEQAMQNTEWETVHIPHTWNNLDGQDGGDNYRRGKGWYKYSFDVKKNDTLDYYIEFLGVNSVADVYINGQHLGQHRGGYTLFRFDLTDVLIDGVNTLLVCADNSPFPDVIPLSADFTFFGGIYREVNLITVPKTHFALDNFGSSGIKLSYDNSPEIRNHATLRVAAMVAGNTDNLKLKVELSVPTEFDGCANIEKTEFKIDAVTAREKNTVAEKTVDVNGSAVACTLGIESPHLWNGKKDPFRYKVVCTLIKNDEETDRVEKYIGFRYFEIKAHKGFFLNGQSYPLRGVNRHQDRLNMGNAITYKEHDEDFAMIYEIGANAIRLAHYPHHPHFYELCDKYGLLVWAEIPFVDDIGGLNNSSIPTDNKVDPSVTESQLQNCKQQLTELILQQCHRPSIFCWSFANEVQYKYKKHGAHMMSELNALAHRLDSTRYSAFAVNDPRVSRWQSDIKGCNIYPGWYSGSPTRFKALYQYHLRGNLWRGMGVSEYGAGSNINHHTENPSLPKNTVCEFHSEEWQAIVHEHALEYFMSPKSDKIWGTFVWNMFDFAIDKRNEGGMPGMNDKGLVTYDRKTRKDVFYLYRSYWSKEPTLYITSRRFTVREKQNICVKVYSNADWVSLTVNGKKLEKLTSAKCRQEHVFLFPDVSLNTGSNEVIAEGSNGTYDSVTWEYKG